MIDGFIHTLQAQFQNQLFVGGLALGIVGVLVAMLRNIPGLMWTYGRRLIVATAVIDSRTNLFDALVVWLNDLPFGRNSRFFTVIQANADPDDEASQNGMPRLLYSPAPGFHFFWLLALG